MPQDYILSVLCANDQSSEVSQLALHDKWEDKHDRALLKVLTTSDSFPMLRGSTWTNDSKLVRKRPGVSNTGRICKCVRVALGPEVLPLLCSHLSSRHC